MQWQICQSFARKLDGAAAFAQNAHDRAQSGLAHAVTAQDGDGFTFANREIDAMRDMAFIVPGMRVPDAERFALSHDPCPYRRP